MAKTNLLNDTIFKNIFHPDKKTPITEHALRTVIGDKIE
jgi:hypothetical protein